MSVTISEAVKYIGVDDKTIDLFESQYVVPHGVAIFFIALICAAPPTRDTERPALIAGRKPAWNISVSR